MKLSIIIVNWNTQQLLRDCLESVRSGSQNLEAEIIVVDNASADGSANMVRAAFPEVVLIENRENRGFAAANNQAILVAQGTYMLLLNSDTLVHGDVLAQAARYMHNNDHVGAMGCRVLNTDGSLQTTCGRFPSLLNLTLLTSALWKLPGPAFFDRFDMTHWTREDEREVETITGCFLLVRKTAIEDIGLLDESFFFYGEETDWCKRLREAGWSLRFAPVGTITHHGGASARQLNYRRDILLSSAMVRLHLKHSGKLSAMVAWLILLLFMASRALYWGLAAHFKNDPDAKAKQKHFLDVLKHYCEVSAGPAHP